MKREFNLSLGYPVPIPKARTVFTLLSAFIAIWMLWVSGDYGITWDEWGHAQNGNWALRCLWGDIGSEPIEGSISVLFCDPVYMATSFFYGLSQGSVLNFVRHGLKEGSVLRDYFLLAHFLMALIGFVAILFTGLLAKELGNWKTGILALGLIFLSPRFVGNCMNNPKDIPFAAMHVFAFYFMVLWIKALPRPSFRLSAALAFGIAAGIWARSGALILIVYLFFFGIVYAFYQQKLTQIPAPWGRLMALTFMVALAGYLGASVLWPYARVNPLLVPVQSLLAFSNFTAWNYYCFFDGSFIKSSQLPWYYLPKWILISSPLFFLTGLCFLFLLMPKIAKARGVFFPSIVGIGAIFPLVFIVLCKSIIYTGWRHVLFIYPLWIVLISLAFHTAWAMMARTGLRILLGTLFFVQVLEPAVWMIRNHPHEYVYFNSLVGGLRGAFEQYDVDYWGNSLRKGAEWLADYHLRNAPDRRMIVRADGNQMSSYPFLYRKLRDQCVLLGFPESFLKTAPHWYISYAPLCFPEHALREPWDYALALAAHRTSAVIRKDWWPPQGTIHEVKADGMTLCAVVKNPLRK